MSGARLFDAQTSSSMHTVFFNSHHACSSQHHSPPGREGLSGPVRVAGVSFNGQAGGIIHKTIAGSPSSPLHHRVTMGELREVGASRREPKPEAGSLATVAIEHLNVTTMFAHDLGADRKTKTRSAHPFA